jgi:hypothetical protein
VTLLRERRSVAVGLASIVVSYYYYRFEGGGREGGRAVNDVSH